MAEQTFTYSKGFPFPCPSISNLRPFTAPSICSLILISGLITLCRMKSVAHLKYQSMNLWIWSKTIFCSTTLTMMEGVRIDIRLIQLLLFSFCPLPSHQGEWSFNPESCYFKPEYHNGIQPYTSCNSNNLFRKLTWRPPKKKKMQQTVSVYSSSC